MASNRVEAGGVKEEAAAAEAAAEAVAAVASMVVVAEAEIIQALKPEVYNKRCMLIRGYYQRALSVLSLEVRTKKLIMDRNTTT